MTFVAFLIGLLIGTIVGIAVAAILRMTQVDDGYADTDYPENEQMEMFK